MNRALFKSFAFLLVAIVIVIAFNSSWLAPVPETELRILSHRGVHQTYHRRNLTNETCTAERIFEPAHSFLENTLPSIDAAFDVGADMVELDIHRTSDGEFAVFHDWTLDCRTNGTGRIANHTMSALRRLDLGYGYTADGGKTYPLRGRGIGMMPTLAEVLQAFPSRAFLVNVKSDQADQADALFAYLSRLKPSALAREVMLISGPRFAARWRGLETGISVATKPEATACLRNYLLTGWLGNISEACLRSGVLGVPQNMTWLIPGWPRKTVARFEQAGLKVVLVGPLDGLTMSIDTLEQVRKIPDDYRGWVMTNRIELVGPALRSE